MRACVVAGPMLLAVLSGCTSDLPLTPTTPTTRSTEVAGLVARGLSPAESRRTIHDDFDDLVGEVPGFAGLFYDSTGTLTISLKNASTLEGSRARIVAYLSRNAAGHFARLSEVSDHVARMRVRRATYDFRELRQWYRQHVTTKLLGARGVTMTQIDEQRNRIVVGVRDDSFIPLLRARIAATDIPPDAITVVRVPATVVGGPTIAASDECDPTIAIIECPIDHGGGFGASYTLNQTARPVAGGMQIQYFQASSLFTCTLGFNVSRRVGGALDPNRFFVTAGHCANALASGSTSMGQPSPSAAIGQEFANPAYFGHSVDPECPVDRMCRRSDVAMYTYLSSGLGAGPSVAFPAVGSWYVTDIRQVASVGYSLLGQNVHLIGQKSGHTTGSVVATCLNVPVFTLDNQDTGRTLLCQDQANFVNDLGDSGSPVVAVASDGSLVAVGVYWGRQSSTVALLSPLSAVLGELNAATNSSVIFINP